MANGRITPADRSKPHPYLKAGEFNHFRAVVQGPRIQKWVNGQRIVDTADPIVFDGFDNGFIALQLHGSGNYSIAFKNIRIRPLD